MFSVLHKLFSKDVRDTFSSKKRSVNECKHTQFVSHDNIMNSFAKPGVVNPLYLLTQYLCAPDHCLLSRHLNCRIIHYYYDQTRNEG